MATEQTDTSPTNEDLSSTDALSICNANESPFFLLPSELRNNIYEYVAKDAVALVTNNYKNRIVITSPLSAVCRQLRSEFILILSSQTPDTLVATVRNFNFEHVVSAINSQSPSIQFPGKLEVRLLICGMPFPDCDSRLLDQWRWSISAFRRTDSINLITHYVIFDKSYAARPSHVGDRTEWRRRMNYLEDARHKFGAQQRHIVAADEMEKMIQAISDHMTRKLAERWGEHMEVR
jgi:hypothetical protein